MYEAFYKFQGKPFRLTPDPAMLFPSRSHKRAMSYLMYGFEQGEGFVMITGAVGTGKTLLLQKLFEDLAHRNVTIANIASANLDSDDVLPAVASELNLPFEGRSKEALLHDLKQHLVARSARHSRTLLVVDEAQTLTPAALEMLRILSNLEQRGRALLQVFLVGQSDLRHVIVANRMEQLRQRIIATFRLEPMEFDESREYILHRLHAVAGKVIRDSIPRSSAASTRRVVAFPARSTRSWTDCCCLAISKSGTPWTRRRSPPCSRNWPRKCRRCRRRWNPRFHCVAWQPSTRPRPRNTKANWPRLSTSATRSCCN